MNGHILRRVHGGAVLFDATTLRSVAAELVLSLHTVRKILAKLGAHSKLEAVVIALRHGLIDLDGPPQR